MPIISTDDYKPPIWLPDSQSQTIFPSIFRKVEGVNYVRERIKTDDGDFLDIDLSEYGVWGLECGVEENKLHTQNLKLQ